MFDWVLSLRIIFSIQFRLVPVGGSCRRILVRRRLGCFE